MLKSLPAVHLDALTPVSDNLATYQTPSLLNPNPHRDRGTIVQNSSRVRPLALLRRRPRQYTSFTLPHDVRETYTEEAAFRLTSVVPVGLFNVVRRSRSRSPPNKLRLNLLCIGGVGRCDIALGVDRKHSLTS